MTPTRACILALLLLCALLPSGAQAALTLRSWTYLPEISTSIILEGDSTEGCSPIGAFVTSHPASLVVPQGEIDVTLHSFGGCSFERAWTVGADLRLVQAGRYHVTVRGPAGQPLNTFFIDVRRGGAIPEAIPSTGPAAAAALALLLVLAAAHQARRRKRAVTG